MFVAKKKIGLWMDGDVADRLQRLVDSIDGRVKGEVVTAAVKMLLDAEPAQQRAALEAFIGTAKLDHLYPAAEEEPLLDRSRVIEVRKVTVPGEKGSIPILPSRGPRRGPKVPATRTSPAADSGGRELDSPEDSPLVRSIVEGPDLPPATRGGRR